MERRPEDEALFQALRGRRLKLAKEQGREFLDMVTGFVAEAGNTPKMV
ncbi:hypothetical protein ACM64Y_15705 [Novispirillum sp. DQ9]